MARSKKQVTEQMQSFAEELKNIQNSDKFHQLFDILCEYEADGGSSEDECGKFIQKYIQDTFFKELHDASVQTEVQFILTSLRKVIRSEKYACESREFREDLVQGAIEKIIGNAKYDLTAPEGKKFVFIRKVLENLFLDRCRARTSEKEATKKFVQLHSSKSKPKRVA